MAKLSPEERAELERKLKEDDDADDYDPEVEVGHAGGGYDRMPYSLARKHHPGRFPDPEPPSPEGEGEGEGKPKGKGQQGGGQVRAFGRRVG